MDITLKGLFHPLTNPFTQICQEPVSINVTAYCGYSPTWYIHSCKVVFYGQYRQDFKKIMHSNKVNLFTAYKVELSTLILFCRNNHYYWGFLCFSRFLSCLFTIQSSFILRTSTWRLERCSTYNPLDILSKIKTYS